MGTCSQFSADLGEDTKARLAKGRALDEMLKQFTGAPYNLRQQVSILSLANQDLTQGLDLSKIQTFVNAYLAVPQWVFLFVPVRLVGLSVLASIN